jgi:putative restriction endonuclease
MDSSTIGRLYNSNHVRCLQWFEDHAGQEARFSDLVTDGIKLVTQFKGIFKPEWMPYVLSIRTTEQERYADGRVIRQDDGSWRMSYAQEEDNRFDSRKLFTNRGIEACMNDGIPIGILRKERKEDPYEVAGLGLPIDWRDEFFTFVSYKPGATPELPGTPEAEAERLAWPGTGQEPIPDSDYDARIRVLAEIARRQGQPAFRTRLLAAYGGRCAVTGCDVPDALEAAHLRPYRGPASNTVANGILLRADLHTLLEKQLIAIHPESRFLELSRWLQGTAYSSLAGKRISDPQDPGAAPAAELLRESWNEFMNAEQERSMRRLWHPQATLEAEGRA